MTVTELLCFRASEVFLANPNLLDEAKKELLGIKGLVSAHRGIQVEDGITAYALFEWETIQDHMNLKNDKSRYEPLMNQLRLAIAGQYEVQHIELKQDPSKAMSAPTTEFVRLTLKEGKSKEELVSLLDKISKELDGAKGAYPPATWGPSVENEGTFIHLVGWDNVEAHMEAIQANIDIFKSYIGPLSEIADIKQWHVKLTQ